MNWLDFALIGGLLITLILGSKIGLVRSTMRFIALAAGVIITTNNSDIIAVEVARHIDASPMVIALISFVILLAVLYGVFRLVVLAFYKVSKLQSLGRVDRIGGGLMGAVRGWVFFGFIFFLLSLLPLPKSFYRMVDNSTLTKPMMKSIPILYEGTHMLHPSNRSFVDKVETSLEETNKVRFELRGDSEYSIDRHEAQEKVSRTMDTLRRYFGPLTLEG